MAECPSPHIDLIEAVISSLSITALYVGSLYLPFNRGDRDEPSIIRRRLLTLAILLVAVELYVQQRLNAALQPRLMPDLAALAVGLSLTLLLYAGHLAAVPLRDGLRYSVSDRHERYLALRNYALGPLLEEICFRRHALLLWSCHSAPLRIAFAATVFALAHVHHVVSVGYSLMFTQFVITFLFGTYASALYVNTRSVWASFAAHVVCNILELPSFEAISSHPRRTAITAFYVVALVTFAVAFAPITALVHPRSSASQ